MIACSGRSGSVTKYTGTYTVYYTGTCSDEIEAEATSETLHVVVVEPFVGDWIACGGAPIEPPEEKDEPHPLDPPDIEYPLPTKIAGVALSTFTLKHWLRIVRARPPPAVSLILTVVKGFLPQGLPASRRTRLRRRGCHFAEKFRINSTNVGSRQMGIIYDAYNVPDLHRYEPEFNEDGTEKHIRCEGARYHVLSYTSMGIRCSCANCEINKREEY